MICLDSQTVSVWAEFWSVVRGLLDLYAYPKFMHNGVVVCEVWIENQGIQNLWFLCWLLSSLTLETWCCSSGHVGNVMIVNTLDALEKTPGTPFCLAFALSYQQWWSSQGVLQVNLCFCESKTTWKVSNNRFQILLMSCWLTLGRKL